MSGHLPLSGQSVHAHAHGKHSRTERAGNDRLSKGSGQMTYITVTQQPLGVPSQRAGQVGRHLRVRVHHIYVGLCVRLLEDVLGGVEFCPFGWWIIIATVSVRLIEHRCQGPVTLPAAEVLDVPEGVLGAGVLGTEDELVTRVASWNGLSLCVVSSAVDASVVVVVKQVD